ncbi:MAG: aspartyl protease family protein [Proteobacteria bacterium]|nr:aspartyl protease family protein [Pseudomonadota bacterium]
MANEIGNRSRTVVCWRPVLPVIVAWALALLLPTAARAACQVQAVELPVTLAGTRAIATVGINGHPVKLVIDTGAFYSFLTETAAIELGLKTTRAPRGLRIEGFSGQVDSHMTRVDRLKLLKGEIPDVEFLVGGSEPGEGAVGLIGRNLLDAVDTEYDLANGMIRFMTPQDCGDRNLAYWAGSAPVSMLPLEWGRAAELPAIETVAKINGKEIRVLFDTGAQSVVTLKAARRAGIAPEAMTPTGRHRGLGTGDVPAWTASFDTFEIGGERISNNRFTVADYTAADVDMLIGIDFFLSHRIYVSRSQRRLYFTYNGGPVFALNAVASAASSADAASTPEGNATSSGAAPTDAAGYARRGAASIARRDYARALADLDRACELDPQAAAYLALRGKVRVALGDPARALQDYDAALRIDPSDSDARLQRAELRQRRNDRAGALADLDELDRALTPQSSLRLEVGKLYLELGNNAALAQFDLWIRTHRLDPSVDQGMNQRCWAGAMLATELDQSLALCNSAVQLRPAMSAYLDSRGWVQLRRGAYREAQADYDAALKLDPKLPWSLYGRGIARLRSGGDAAQARSDIDAAHQLLPTIDKEAGRYGISVPE